MDACYQAFDKDGYVTLIILLLTNRLKCIWIYSQFDMLFNFKPPKLVPHVKSCLILDFLCSWTLL